MTMGGKTKMKFLYLCLWLQSCWESTCQAKPIVELLEGHFHKGKTTSGPLDNWSIFFPHVFTSTSASLSLIQS